VFFSQSRRRFEVTVRLAVQNQADLLFLGARAKTLAAEKYVEFERHIETWQSVHRVEFDGRNIMYSEPAFLNETLYFCQTHFTGVIGFAGTSRPEPEIANSKNNRVENRTVAIIKRTIDED